MPNVVDDFDIRDDILSINVKHESVVVGEGERIIDFLGRVRNNRAVIEVIVRLDPSTERNLIQVVCRTSKLHIIADARLLEVEHKIWRREQLAPVTVEERRTFARELIEDCFIVH